MKAVRTDGRKSSIIRGRRCSRCEGKVMYAAGGLRAWCQHCGDYVTTRALKE